MKMLRVQGKKKKIVMIRFSNKKQRDDMLLTYKFIYSCFFHIKAKRPIYDFTSICQQDHIVEYNFIVPSRRCKVLCHLTKMQTVLEYQNYLTAQIFLCVNSIKFGSLKMITTKLIHTSDNTHL